MEENSNESQVENSSTDFIHQATNRIMLQESLKYLRHFEEIEKFIDSDTLLKSAEILGKREVSEAANREEDDDDTEDQEAMLEKNIQLRERRNQLLEALIRHKSIHTALQNSLFETQIQNAVYNSLENDSTLPPEIKNMMELYQRNLSICTKLSDLFMKTEAHEKRIQELRQNYRNLLQSIEEKWTLLIGLKPTVTQKTEELEKLSQNVKKREDRLHLVVSFLQNLISASGTSWGKNERIVETMLLCDKVESFLGGHGDILQDMRGLQLARENEREQNRRNTRKGPIDKFVSSTPR